MNVHGNVELLSSFVDDELEAPTRQAVEQHLEGCLPCRQRLQGLRRVVDGLHRLEETAPPPALAARVRRALSVESTRATPLRRGEQALRRWIDQPMLMPLFGVVTALAVFLYLFSAWSDQSRRLGTRLVIAPAEEAATEAAGATGAVEGDEKQVAGRVFHRLDGHWVEPGVDPAAAVRQLDLTSPSPDWQALELYREVGDQVVLRWETEILEIVFARAAPDR